MKDTIRRLNFYVFAVLVILMPYQVIAQNVVSEEYENIIQLLIENNQLTNLNDAEKKQLANLAQKFLNSAEINYIMYHYSLILFTDFSSEINNILSAESNKDLLEYQIVKKDLEYRLLSLFNKKKEIKNDLVLNNNYANKNTWLKGLNEESPFNVSTVYDFIAAWGLHSSINECKIVNRNWQIVCQMVTSSNHLTIDNLKGLLELRKNDKNSESREEILKEINTDGISPDIFNHILKWNEEILINALSDYITAAILYSLSTNMNVKNSAYEALVLLRHRELANLKHLSRNNTNTVSKYYSDFIENKSCSDGTFTSDEIEYEIRNMPALQRLGFFSLLATCADVNVVQQASQSTLDDLRLKFEQLSIRNTRFNQLSNSLWPLVWTGIQLKNYSLVDSLYKTTNSIYSASTPIENNHLAIIQLIHYLDRDNATNSNKYRRNIRAISVHFEQNQNYMHLVPVGIAVQLITIPELLKSINTRLN